MSLKPVSSFSKEQIEEASKSCPAIQRYFEIIKNYPDLLSLEEFSPLKLDQDFSKNIVLIRHQIWLNCALATYFNSQNVEKVCRYWSDQVDQILLHTWNECKLHEEPLLLTSMGKLGAQELNLSSDVDLVLISKEVCDSNLLKKIKLFTNSLTQHTEYGFCLRIDYNLRPGGRFGPLVSSIHQFQDYYWSQGETWERLALSRLRILNENFQLCLSLEKIKNRFVFRKFIDYTLFEDLKNIRKRIQENHLTNNEIKNFHLKLGTGGIRDIELFLHAHQIIHGGRIPQIKTVSTTKICEHIKAHHLLDPEHVDTLLNAYWIYREIENKIQIFEDQQTHLWHSHLKYPSLKDDEIQKLIQLTEGVNSIVSTLLGPVLTEKNPLPTSIEMQMEWLKSHQYSKDVIEKTWPQLIELTAKSVRGQKDEAIRKIFLFEFIEKLSEININKDLGIKLLVDFIRSTRVKASFFSLLLNEKTLLNDLAHLFSVSPHLSHIITSRPELLDNFFLNSQAEYSTDFETLLDQLAEKRLLSEIIASKEFLISKNISRLTSALTITADSISSHLFDTLKRQYQSQTLEILTLGKWGGEEIGLKSDLDFIFVAFHPPTPQDHKVARRFLSRLSDQHKGGVIYEVDLRLRPTGKAGPLIVNWDRLLDYLKNEAETWELQSYLRSRFLDKKLNSSISIELQKAIFNKDITDKKLDGLKKIKKSLVKMNPADHFDFKYAPGGLLEMELGAQYSILKHKIHFINTSTGQMLNALFQENAIKRELFAALNKNYNFLRLLEQFFQLITSHSGSLISTQSEHFLTLSKLLNIPSHQLKNQISGCLNENKLLLRELDGDYFSS